jgi:hypothetical protein
MMDETSKPYPYVGPVYDGPEKSCGDNSNRIGNWIPMPTKAPRNVTDKPSYYPTVMHVDDKVISFFENGSITIRHKDSTVKTSVAEMDKIICLSHTMRNFKLEHYNRQLANLDADRDFNAARDERLRKNIKDEYDSSK